MNQTWPRGALVCHPGRAGRQARPTELRQRCRMLIEVKENADKISWPATTAVSKTPGNNQQNLCTGSSPLVGD